jgi:hypothetical protein
VEGDCILVERGSIYTHCPIHGWEIKEHGAMAKLSQVGDKRLLGENLPAMSQQPLHNDTCNVLEFNRMTEYQKTHCTLRLYHNKPAYSIF